MESGLSADEDDSRPVWARRGSGCSAVVLHGEAGQVGDAGHGELPRGGAARKPGGVRSCAAAALAPGWRGQAGDRRRHHTAPARGSRGASSLVLEFPGLELKSLEAGGSARPSGNRISHLRVPRGWRKSGRDRARIKYMPGAAARRAPPATQRPQCGLRWPARRAHRDPPHVARARCAVPRCRDAGGRRGGPGA